MTTATNVRQRNVYIDFLKFILIGCVVYGHIGMGDTSMDIIKCVYFFHMPVFVFVSGYLSTHHSIGELNAWATRLLKVLIIWHILYVCFSYTIRIAQPSWPLLLIRPYQHLWYLLSLICWRYVLHYSKLRNIKCKQMLMGG